MHFVITVSETVTVEELIDEILADKVTPPNPSEGNSQNIETNPQSPSLPADEDEPSKSLYLSFSVSLSLWNNLLTFVEQRIYSEFSSF